jgi:hypothetical protein
VIRFETRYQNFNSVAPLAVVSVSISIFLLRVAADSFDASRAQILHTLHESAKRPFNPSNTATELHISPPTSKTSDGFQSRSNASQGFHRLLNTSQKLKREPRGLFEHRGIRTHARRPPLFTNAKLEAASAQLLDRERS